MIILSCTIISLFLISSILLLLRPYKVQNIEVKLKFDEKSANNAYDIIDDQLDIGYRIPGEEESEECIEYFISKFRDINSDFTYKIHNFTVHSTDCQNVLFKLNEQEENIVILASHYDSRAKATKDDSNPNDPVPGANDGASSCAVLIELAKILYDRREDLDCQIWFLFFDAEDQGRDEGGYGIDGWGWCEGSTEFVDDLDSFYDSEEEDFDCMILLDMVGGNGLQFIKEEHSTSSLLDEIFEIGRQLGFYKEFPLLPISSSVFDDHVVFLEEDIPSADLIINFWSNPEWPHHHTTEDDLSHISRKSLEISGKTVEQFIYNNYYDKFNKNYQGNSPWKEDTSYPDSGLILIFISLIAVVVVLPLIYYFRHYRNKKKEIVKT